MRETFLNEFGLQPWGFKLTMTRSMTRWVHWRGSNSERGHLASASLGLDKVVTVHFTWNFGSERERQGSEAVRHGWASATAHKSTGLIMIACMLCDIKRNFKRTRGGYPDGGIECRQARTDQWTRRGKKKEAGPVPKRKGQMAGTGTFSLGGRKTEENTKKGNDDENCKTQTKEEGWDSVLDVVMGSCSMRR